MIRGRIIAESIHAGHDIQLPDMRLIRLGRHDVTKSTLPTGDRSADGDDHGVVAGQPAIWTFVDFEAPDSLADDLAEALTGAIQAEFGWWADFTIGDSEHVIVFAGRSFRYQVADEAGRAEAVAYARSLGTPGSQLDWGL